METKIWNIGGSCRDGSCPQIFKLADGRIMVQGTTPKQTPDGIKVPSHESLVEIPEALLQEYAKLIANA